MTRPAAPPPPDLSERIGFTDQGGRLRIFERELIAGLAIVRREHPDSDDEWQARWLGGYLAGLLLSMATAIEREARQPYQDALRQINDIRNSIVGHQNGNWSLHIYPLVAALNAAGLPGLDYDEAKATLAEIDRRILTDQDANNARSLLSDTEASRP